MNFWEGGIYNSVIVSVEESNILLIKPQLSVTSFFSLSLRVT